MTNRSEKLAQAARLVEEVAGELDAGEKPCRSCGLRKASNWGELQAHREITTAARKLRKAAEALSTNGDRDRPEENAS